MSNLVAVTHGVTGHVYQMHPDLAAQQHRWVHPDPSVPTPPESLPFFDGDGLDKLIVRLAAQPQQHPTPSAAPVREKAAANHA